MDEKITAVKNPKTLGVDLGFEHDPTDDEMGFRKVETTNGEYHVITNQQTGLMNITVPKGKLPEALKGLYTSQREVERAISTYLSGLKN